MYESDVDIKIYNRKTHENPLGDLEKKTLRKQGVPSIFTD